MSLGVGDGGWNPPAGRMLHASPCTDVGDGLERLVVQQGWLGMEDELRYSTDCRRAIGPEGIQKETK